MVCIFFTVKHFCMEIFLKKHLIKSKKVSAIFAPTNVSINH